jgi:hypothetical protein
LIEKYFNIATIVVIILLAVVVYVIKVLGRIWPIGQVKQKTEGRRQKSEIVGQIFRLRCAPLKMTVGGIQNLQRASI